MHLPPQPQLIYWYLLITLILCRLKPAQFHIYFCVAINSNTQTLVYNELAAVNHFCAVQCGV